MIRLLCTVESLVTSPPRNNKQESKPVPIVNKKSPEGKNSLEEEEDEQGPYGKILGFSGIMEKKETKRSFCFFNFLTTSVYFLFCSFFTLLAKEEPTTPIKESPPSLEIGSPSNFQHKVSTIEYRESEERKQLHVDLKLEWSNLNTAKDFKLVEKLGEG